MSKLMKETFYIQKLLKDPLLYSSHGYFSSFFIIKACNGDIGMFVQHSQIQISTLNIYRILQEEKFAGFVQ